jgi:hypothetical protein
MRWNGHVERMGKEKNAFKFLARNAEGKRRLGNRSCLAWEDNIKTDVKEIG